MIPIKTYVANKFVEFLEEDFGLNETDSLQEYFDIYGLFTPTDYSIGRIFWGLAQTKFLYADCAEEAETDLQREEGIKKCSNILVGSLQNDDQFILLNYSTYTPFQAAWPRDYSDTFEYDERIVVLASEPYTVTVDEDYLHYVQASTVVKNADQINKVSKLALEHHCPAYTLMGLTTHIVCAIYEGGVVTFNPIDIPKN